MPVTYRLRQEARELRQIIRTINTELDEHHKNVNIANATGSAVSLLGGGDIVFMNFFNHFNLVLNTEAG